MSVSLRQLTVDDIDDLQRISQTCYTLDLREQRECIVHKYLLFPKGYLGVFVEHELIGYVVFHPWKLNLPVSLNDSTYVLPGISDCIYIHDLAILPGHRHANCSAQLIHHMMQIGQELNLVSYALVAVQNSEPYWERWGFKAIRLMKYGNSPATYMICEGMPRWE